MIRPLPVRPLSVLASAVVLAGCFIPPKYDCRLLCADDTPCPNGYQCIPLGNSSTRVCAPQGKLSCDDSLDAGAPRDTTAAADTPPPDPAPGPPPAEICYPGPENCLTLSPAVQAGLALWLDPSNLPPQGQPVPVWHDRSGQANHARAAINEAVPQSEEGGARMVATLGAGFKVAPSPSLLLGTDPFVFYVVARLTPAFTCLASRDNRAVGSLRRRVALEWLPRSGGLRPGASLNDDVILVAQGQPDLGDLRPHLMMAARTGDQLHLSIDTRPVPPLDVPERLDVATEQPFFLGTCYEGTLPVRQLQAVVVVRGELSDPDRSAVSAFLMKAFQIAP